MKRNVPILGLIIGLLLPILGVFIIYLIKFHGVSFGEFLKAMFSSGKVASTVLSLAILINIIPFIFYTNRRLDYTARGIFIATMLYAVLYVLLKFVW